jgi:hypothetical protein
MEVNTIIIRAEGVLKRIITPVTVCQSVLLIQHAGLSSISIDASAMWDTGADSCCISASLAAELGLTSIGSFTAHGFQSSGEYPGYMLDITLPDGQSALNVPVVAFDKRSNYDIIIGMNIISLGRFVIDNNKGNTIFSFQFGEGAIS